MSQIWKPAVPVADLKRKGRMVFRIDGKQIALFHTAEGVLACNNRCPHEGYPLREGFLDDACVLTCNWHNWKFDLKTGNTLDGGDRLRVYPAEIRGDEVWLDLSEPPFEVRREETLQHLRRAFQDNDYERMARELGRLHWIGADLLDAVRSAIHWSYRHMQFGWTHAYAGTADWLALYDEHQADDEIRLICLLEAVAHAADDVSRRPLYAFTEERLAYEEEGFVQAIEREDEATAVAMLRGGLADGLAFDEFERGLSRAALLHYNDFGHSLIYVAKAGRLIRRLGASVAEPLLISLVRSLVFATREDLIPEFRPYRAALEAWDGKGRERPAVDAWWKLGVGRALERTIESSGATPERLYHALLGANALNMLAFDVGQQDKVRIPVSDNVGWLDFTHGITFANAVRLQCSRFPELWPSALLQMACFSGRNAAFTQPEPDWETWRVEDVESFLDSAIERLFDHGMDEFIVSVHFLKTLIAAREEVRAGAPREVSQALAAALSRMLNSPLKLKQVRRSVYQAMQFVARDG